MASASGFRVWVVMIRLLGCRCASCMRLSWRAARGRSERVPGNVQEIDVEDKRGVAGDGPHALRPISEIGREDQAPLAARFHRRDTLVPAFDHLACPDFKRERVAAVK